MNRARIVCALLLVAGSHAVAQVRVQAPTVEKDVSTLKKQSLGQSTKKALNSLPKSRVYVLSARLAPLGAPPVQAAPNVLGTTAGERFCRASSPNTFTAVVSIQYEWRPSLPASAGGVLASLIVRKHDGEMSWPVTLGSHGVAQAGIDPARLGFLTLAKADICPTGCIDARLAPSDARDANRVDQRWQRACWR
jgi:hypothetical protein